MEAYRAYSVVRGSWWQVASHPRVLAAGAIAAAEGHIVGRPMGDTKMLPASFVIKDRVIVFAHRGETSSDITPPSELIAAIAAT